MEYITLTEAAEKWGISTRAITYHVVAGRIPGAEKKGNLWLIPTSAQRPEDRRRGKRTPDKKTSGNPAEDRRRAQDAK